MLRKAALAASVVASMPDRLPFDQSRVGEPLQDPRENRLMRFEIDQPARARNRRMIRRRVRQHQPDKLAHGKRIPSTPGDVPLRVQALKRPVGNRRK